MKKLMILIGLYLGGCASISQDLDPKVYYKHDMMLTVNGVNALGVAVAKRMPEYKITITSQEDMDLLQVSSCSQDIDRANAIKTGWFGKRTFTFTYTPNSVERESGCMLKIAGYNKAEGKHSWAFIDFEDPKFVLPAGLACNGTEDYRSDGVSVCQTLQRLIMQIWFQNRVLLSDKVLDRCKVKPKVDDGVHFQFQVAPRECIYEFMEVKAPYRRHRLTTIGYEQVPVRVGD